jgi:ubiquinone/menaquinone biosynthesis C-methylase UbiE
MKRAPLAHDRVFGDQQAAATYARKHQNMADRLAREYSQKLCSRGFQRGRVIDVGCGSGGTVISLAEEFADSQFVGIDLSEPLLQYAEAAAQEAGVGDRVRFEVADVQQMPFDDDSFDVATNLNMVHIVERPIQMLNEIERILVPRGILFIADLKRSWLGVLEKEIKSALTTEEAQSLFGQSRLRKGTFSSDLLWWRFEA